MSGYRIPPIGEHNTHFYSATKYAVTALTEGTRRELRAMKSRVRVTVSVGVRLSEVDACRLTDIRQAIFKW